MAAPRPSTFARPTSSELFPRCRELLPREHATPSTNKRLAPSGLCQLSVDRPLESSRLSSNNVCRHLEGAVTMLPFREQFTDKAAASPHSRTPKTRTEPVKIDVQLFLQQLRSLEI